MASVFFGWWSIDGRSRISNCIYSICAGVIGLCGNGRFYAQSRSLRFIFGGRFFCSAVLWMLLQAEFLSLVLIFVYVGAVMTLFLFVVMMLDIDLAPLKEGFVRYLPLGLVVLAFMVGIMLFVLNSKQFSSATMVAPTGPNYNNTAVIGTELFTHYIYEFEIAGLILLVAMVAAISLAFYGRKPGTKSQKISQQLMANKASGLRVIKMKSES